MHAFDLNKEQQWNLQKHVEKVLGKEGGGDSTVACWEPGQISPYHCHPHATEIYFCYTGGGKMYTPTQEIDIVPGSFVVHPRGELHEFVNGPERTMLFRVRHGEDMVSRHIGWRGHPEASGRPADLEYFAKNPPGITFNPNGVSR
jgi:quercetin dioxygenase-like cupin family protein